MRRNLFSNPTSMLLKALGETNVSTSSMVCEFRIHFSPQLYLAAMFSWFCFPKYKVVWQESITMESHKAEYWKHCICKHHSYNNLNVLHY